MEDDMLLRPSDRRLVEDDSDLPPGPPGDDTFELVSKQPKPQKEKDSKRSPSPPRSRDPRISGRAGRDRERSSPSPRGRSSPSPRGRRTPSPSSRRNRRSVSRGRDRRSNSRNRGTPSYGRDYSPRRRFGGMRGRRSRERKRSPIRRDLMDRRRDRRSRSRDRYRGRRTPSRSPISRRWSPSGKKPASPTAPAPLPPSVAPMAMTAPPPQFGIPPPNVYADGYGSYPPYAGQQFQPPNAGQQFQPEFQPAIPPPPPFAAAYPPPPTWNVVSAPPGAEDFASQGVGVGWGPVPPPQQQQPQPQQPPPMESEEDQQKREAAVAQEVQNQREQLRKQRNDYLKRAGALKREMKILKQQRNYLVSGDEPPSPTTKGFLDENDNLQNQIQKKLSTIENVIDMLNGIIGEDKPTSPSSPRKSSKSSSTTSSTGATSRKGHSESNKTIKDDNDNDGGDDDDDDDSSPERLKSKLIESMKNKRDAMSRADKDKEKDKGKDKDRSRYDTSDKSDIKIKSEFKDKKYEDVHPSKKINYTFYDPEMHWCQNCDVFPKTAKDYLNHLHSQQHKDNVAIIDTPWHDHIVSDDFPNYPNVPSKRAPIRGLQFFVPATAWYCKLCDFWMGDLHCASAHLKSQTHSNKYNKFFEQNPHFEMDWMAERQKVYDNLRAPPPPQITSVSTTGMDLLESIPLQINNQKNIENEKSSSKKRKKKSDEKKEKKKKKRGKKRKKAETSSSSSSSSSSGSSSSSSSSSESTESDAETKAKDKLKKMKEMVKDISGNAHSIRVAMRNLTKPQPQSQNVENNDNGRGKWTTVQEGEVVAQPIPPPPPRIATPPSNDPDAKKKDELMMTQWNAPVQPIITESEKKFLEELKGKLKSKPLDGEKKRDSGTGKNDSKKKDDKDKRSRSKERTREKSRDRSKRSRSKDIRGRDRRGSRERRSRSPRDNKGRGRVSPIRRRRRSRSPRRRSRSPSNRYGRRRSYSRSRSSRSRTHSRSRSKSTDRRIEKPVVRYPEFRPRVPPENKKVTKLKTDEESERKRSPSIKKKEQQSSGDKKKLPFIGRMPVFKKQPQGNENEKKETDNENTETVENPTVSTQKPSKKQPEAQPLPLPQPQPQPQQQLQLQLHLAQQQQQQQPEHVEMNYEQHYYDYEDLMPDPMQYVTLMGAPPPPPSEPPPEETDEKDILPPGVDETETDLIPKPISDAPIPKKGPLPKDFEEALNIIFPGEKKSDEIESSGETSNTEPQNVNGIVSGDVPLNLQHAVFSSDMNVGETVEIATTTNVPMMIDDEISQISMGYPPGIIHSHSELSQDIPMPSTTVADMSYITPASIPTPHLQNIITTDIYNQDELQFETRITTEKEKDSSPTESEKLRRQEELDDLAMLGIDADDLAAQCM